MNKLTDLQKARMYIVKLAIKDNIKVSKLAKDFKLSKTTIYNAIKLYKNELDKKENNWLYKINWRKENE